MKEERKGDSSRHSIPILPESWRMGQTQRGFGSIGEDAHGLQLPEGRVPVLLPPGTSINRILHHPTQSLHPLCMIAPKVKSKWVPLRSQNEISFEII